MKVGNVQNWGVSGTSWVSTKLLQIREELPLLVTFIGEITNQGIKIYPILSKKENNNSKLKHMIKNSESLYKRSNNLQKTEGSVKKIEVSEVKKGTSQPKHFKIRNVQEPIFKEEKFDSHV